MATNYPVNPRVRAYGKARIDIAQRVKNPSDWEKLWIRPSNPFPFVWGESWKHCVEYKVDDFAAEVGFFIDVLGLPVNAFDPGYAMFTSPAGDFYLAVIATSNGETSTPPDAIRLQFMLSDIFATTRELEKRGITFEQPPLPCQPGSSLHISYFRTPHGMCVDLWGTVEPVTPPAVQPVLPVQLVTEGVFDKDREFEQDEDEGDDDFGEEESEVDEDSPMGEEDVEDDDEDLEIDEDEFTEGEDEGEDEAEIEDVEDDEFDPYEHSVKAGSLSNKRSTSFTPSAPMDLKPNAQGVEGDKQNARTAQYIDVDGI
jgi:catechol 2,3-dioxygenase-like lactoylglutathione lyase family enzyme